MCEDSESPQDPTVETGSAVSSLNNVPATYLCISGTDLLRQFYELLL